MHDRPSRFADFPAAMHLPSAALYPEKPMSRWLVRMVVDTDRNCAPHQAVISAWQIETHVWADSSLDAVGRARDDFYVGWATLADRQRYPLRVLEVRQVAV